MPYAQGLRGCHSQRSGHFLGNYGSTESHEAYRRLIAEWTQLGTVSTSRSEKIVRPAMIDAGHSRKHINKNIDRLRRMFKWAAAEELISASVPQSLGMVAGLRCGRTEARETDPIVPVDYETVAATIQHLPEVVADMVRLQRLTGMRLQEICSIRLCNIDRTGEVWIYVPDVHKTEHHGRKRRVFIGPKGQVVLLRYLARDARGNECRRALADRGIAIPHGQTYVN